MKSTRAGQTRRTFFAAIGVAILGKYAVKFWPKLVAHENVDYLARWDAAADLHSRTVLDYVTACHEQAMHTFAAYLDDCLLNGGGPRQNAVITGISISGYRMRTTFDPARLPA